MDFGAQGPLWIWPWGIGCSTLPAEVLGLRTSLVVQWLRLHTATAEGIGSIPGQVTKIPMCHVVWPKKEKEKSQVRREGESR